MNLTLQRKKSFKANDVIHDQFIILGKLDNQKHSSKLLKGFDKASRNFVVIKITSAAYKEKNKYVTKILQKLKEASDNPIGVPTIVWRGEIAPDTITVTECLGPNLKKLFMLMDKRFSVPTITMIAIQVVNLVGLQCLIAKLNTLEYIHGQDYVCCNIMPKEILISLHKKQLTLFITDYKQARRVKSGRMATTDSVSHTANKAILNKFSSVNLHLGLPASKKDDLESLGYILVYFFRQGSLFEKRVKINTKEEKIKFYEQQKLTLIPETFCQGLPQEMISYMSHIKAMQTNQAHDKIDYDYLRKLFKNLFNKFASMENFQYDWISKARTYNLENGKRQGEGISQEQSMKSELISLHMEQGSDGLEFDQRQGAGLAGAKRLSKYSSDEYDPFGMDEFTEENEIDQPISTKVNRIQIFDTKIKTIESIKNQTMLIMTHGTGKSAGDFVSVKNKGNVSIAISQLPTGETDLTKYKNEKSNSLSDQVPSLSKANTGQPSQPISNKPNNQQVSNKPSVQQVSNKPTIQQTSTSKTSTQSITNKISSQPISKISSQPISTKPNNYSSSSKPRNPSVSSKSSNQTPSRSKSSKK